LVVLACCLCHASPARSGDVSPPDRAESLTMMFRTICLIEAPNAAHLAARATGMRMALLGDTTTRTEGDTVTRSRRWSGDPNIGGWRLRVDEVSGPVSSAVQRAWRRDGGYGSFLPGIKQPAGASLADVDHGAAALYLARFKNPVGYAGDHDHHSGNQAWQPRPRDGGN